MIGPQNGFCHLKSKFCRECIPLLGNELIYWPHIVVGKGSTGWRLHCAQCTWGMQRGEGVSPSVRGQGPRLVCSISPAELPAAYSSVKVPRRWVCVSSSCHWGEVFLPRQTGSNMVLGVWWVIPLTSVCHSSVSSPGENALLCALLCTSP